MHEVGIATAIVEKASEVSRAHGDRAVSRVTMRIGALRQIVPDTLSFVFEAVSRETPVAGAELECEWVPVRVECAGCASAYAPEEAFWVCPSCGERGGRVIEGDELLLVSVELSDEG